MIKSLEEQAPKRDRGSQEVKMPFSFSSTEVKLERVGLTLPLRPGIFSPKSGNGGLQVGVH